MQQRRAEKGRKGVGGGREDKGSDSEGSQACRELCSTHMGMVFYGKGLGVQNCHSEEQLLGKYCPRTPMDSHLEIQSAGTLSFIW